MGCVWVIVECTSRLVTSSQQSQSASLDASSSCTIVGTNDTFLPPGLRHKQRPIPTAPNSDQLAERGTPPGYDENRQGVLQNAFAIRIRMGNASARGLRRLLDTTGVSIALGNGARRRFPGFAVPTRCHDHDDAIAAAIVRINAMLASRHVAQNETIGNPKKKRRPSGHRFDNSIQLTSSDVANRRPLQSPGSQPTRPTNPVPELS